MNWFCFVPPCCQELSCGPCFPPIVLPVTMWVWVLAVSSYPTTHAMSVCWTDWWCQHQIWRIFSTLHLVKCPTRPEPCPPDLHHQDWRVCQPAGIMKGKFKVWVERQNNPSLQISQLKRVQAQQDTRHCQPATEHSPAHHQGWHSSLTAFLSHQDCSAQYWGWETSLGCSH